MAAVELPVETGAAIPISEIFGPTIQGEGPLLGKLCAFVRVGGCDYRCSWCDTMYAVTPRGNTWAKLSPKEIFAAVAGILPATSGTSPWVVISGGNPCLFASVQSLVGFLHRAHYRVALETQGSVPVPWLSEIDSLVISPKPPSSEMPFGDAERARLAQCLAFGGSRRSVVLKVVIADEADYQFARALGQELPNTDLYLQPCDAPDQPTTGRGTRQAIQSHAMSYRWLVERVIKDQWHEVTVLPRAHVLVWGQERAR